MQCTCAILSSVACAQLYSVFSMLSDKGTIFQKLLLNMKCVFIFTTKFFESISHFKKK